jgi:hypothetical protein
VEGISGADQDSGCGNGDAFAERERGGLARPRAPI